jgi:hypothetical protein
VDGYGRGIVSSGLIALDPESGRKQRWALPGGFVTALVSNSKSLFAIHTNLKENAIEAYYSVSENQAATGRRVRTVAMTGPDDDLTTLYANGSRLYVGGMYAQINHTPRQSLAAFNASSGRLLPWHPAGARPGFGNTLAITSTPTLVAVGVGGCRISC